MSRIRRTSGGCGAVAPSLDRFGASSSPGNIPRQAAVFPKSAASLFHPLRSELVRQPRPDGIYLETRMRLLRLEHVQLAMPAGREDDARAFYAGLLGLPEQPKPEPLARRGGCWFAREDGLKIHLGVDSDFRPARKAHPAFVVEGLSAFRTALVRAGYHVVEDEPQAGHAHLYVDDPFGNRIELMERLTAEGDQACEGQITAPNSCRGPVA